MTVQEQNALDRVEAKVDKLTEAMTTLTVTMAQALQRETDCRTHVQAIHAEVFGVDGDPQRPGLKGQMRDVRAEQDLHKSRLARVWAVILLLFSAVATAAAKHFLP